MSMMMRQSASHPLLDYLVGGSLLATSALVARKAKSLLSKRSIQKPRKLQSIRVTQSTLEARRLDPS